LQGELRNRVSTQTHDNQLSVLPSGLVNSVFTYYLTQISRVIIRLCLDAYPAADYSVLQTAFVDEYFEEISNVVRKHMSGRKELGYLQLNPKYDLVDSCYAALIKLLPPLPENRVIREENDKLGKFLEDLLISGPDASQKTKSLNNIEQKLQTKNFRISLTNFLQFSTTSILKSVLKALSEVSLPQDNLIYQRSFIHYVLESCFSEMIKRRQKSHGYELMPSKVQKANIVSAFGCMLNELFTHKTYRIFFIIINLSLGQRLLEMDGVIFYNPKYWDFGEHYQFDEFRKDAAKNGASLDIEDITVAFKEVQSPHNSDTIERARLYVEEALDRIMFGFKIVKMNDPKKPKIHTSYLIVHLGEQSLEISAYHDHKDPIRLTDDISEFFRRYRDVISSTVNQLDYRHSLGRALSLFRLGLETESNYLKFVTFWNSFEQLVRFLSNIQVIKERLLKTTALYITWKETNSIAQVNNCLNNIYSAINKSERLQRRFDNHPKLKTWRNNRVIVIKHFTIIKKIWKEEKIDNRDIVRLDKLIRINSQSEFDNISKRIEFKTAILYEKGNLLFHEGETPSLLNSYVSILQKLLLDMILITVFRINFPPREQVQRNR
jgi:hypothetical protein